MRPFSALVCWLSLLVGALVPAMAQTRVALVIGNSAYQHSPALPNPINDAGDMASSLRRLGFTVRVLSNAKADDMRRSLRNFASEARRAELAVVFFAGHGMEIGGENWLLPIDAELQTDIAAEYEAIGLRSILPVVAGASKLGLVILDACRNNPFVSKMQRSLPTRAVERGFTRVEPTGSVLVAYAAKDGTTATDGTGRNSPFTSALLANIEKPGLEVGFLFRAVREAVYRETAMRQEPVVYGSLPSTEIYFNPPAGQAAQRPLAAPVDPAERAWTATKDTSSVAILEAFIQQFGATPYGAMARARLEEIKKANVAAARPAGFANADGPAAPSGGGILGGLTDWLTRPSANPPANSGAKSNRIAVARPTEEAPKTAPPVSEIIQRTIPEGLTSEQIVQRLIDDGDLTGNIREIPAEGSLMPGVYTVKRGALREDVIGLMKQARRRVLEEVWEQRMQGLPLRTPEQLVTLASIVEKETGRAEQRPRVAAVFVNRLLRKIKLQSDPTIVYGLVGGKGSLGRPITAAEVTQPTPYNTYVIDGLPPGPIANPSRDALLAVANPARTKELFFVPDGTGGHAFSDTLVEHQKNVMKLRANEQRPPGESAPKNQPTAGRTPNAATSRTGR